MSATERRRSRRRRKDEEEWLPPDHQQLDEEMDAYECDPETEMGTIPSPFDLAAILPPRKRTRAEAKGTCILSLPPRKRRRVDVPAHLTEGLSRMAPVCFLEGPTEYVVWSRPTLGTEGEDVVALITDRLPNWDMAATRRLLTHGHDYEQGRCTRTLPVQTIRAHQEGGLVGCLLFCVHDTYAELLLMAVKKDLQCGGVGSRLIDILKVIVPRTTHSIYVRSDVECVSFYLKNGFTPRVSIPAEAEAEAMPSKCHVAGMTVCPALQCDRRPDGAFWVREDIRAHQDRIASMMRRWWWSRRVRVES